MTFRFLQIELDRSEKTRDICAHVYQTDAEGLLKGKNILSGRHLRLIESAKKGVMEYFDGTIESIEWIVKAEPDFVRKKKEVIAVTA